MENLNLKKEQNAEPIIVVLVKQVPDMNNVKFNVEEGKVDRSSADVEINPFDLNAIEAAVQIKEKIGGRVVAISMGPPQAESALQEAIVRGADRGILLTDRKFGGADTYATSYTLACAIKKLVGAYNLVIAGEKTVDGDTGQVGPEVAEHLGIPHISYVHNIKACDKEKITVLHEAGNSNYLSEIKFPGLITVTKDVNEPRYVSFSKKARAKSLRVDKYGIAEISEGEEGKFGVMGSPTQVFKIVIPPEKVGTGKIFKGPPGETAQKLVDELAGLL